MSENNNRLQEVAQEMLNSKEDLKRDLVSEGVYHTVVEGGHHTAALTDEEADHLIKVIINEGIEGLESLAAEEAEA